MRRNRAILSYVSGGEPGAFLCMNGDGDHLERLIGVLGGFVELCTSESHLSSVNHEKSVW